MSCSLATYRLETCSVAATERDRPFAFDARRRRFSAWSIAIFLCSSVVLTTKVAGEEKETENPTTAVTSDEPAAEFGSTSLAGWRVVDVFDFQDHGKVHVQNGELHLERGKPATGVSWKGDFPRSNYELSFKGRRVAGGDFFCGLTIPVKQEHCTLVLGGWGGQVVGLSNIDGYSAVENETTQAYEFKQGQWYAIRLRVTDSEIVAWIDDNQFISVETEGKKFSLYWEQEPVTPVGLVTWNTYGAIKDLKLQRLTK